ncbi:hypothetical protein NOS3756_58370 (plasmid) [Nostoc sp. NIES-3756]|uniref:hypothetical protein n=1 Tax=Nostoc sp. NIES-3756 TaxID=1751286 RepID=UPI00071FCE18|nr:hypothetical protein [Nostoc sp. NIES-3756]BAT56825.1 hypothetical protein NOS3756_58370 [Nostoc sp. NIES-3756]BAY41835.1 hypothetical protein NIES2111_62310 [Nostoc sp. NIES-2111]BAY41857.1 hypothetical protein NIES2111_62530 [Nostoc sp. NIES-2111]
MTSKLITPESPLLVPPLLAAEIGLTEAMILQQIHYFCQISKHIKRDGRRWFWKTLKDWGETLPFLKPSAIRRAIANLRDKFKLIDVCRHSEKTWYQANWFTVNVENVQALWNRICQNQQIDVSNLDISICSLPADHNRDFPLKDFASQQHSAVELEKSEDEETEILECDQEPICQTPELELPQVTYFVDEPEQVDSTGVKDHHQDELSGAVDEAQLNVSKQEIVEVCNELRRLRINPQPCLGVIKKYWVNVYGAIAAVKEAVQEGWCKNPTGLFINSCKSGTKGKNTVTAPVDAWFSWAYKQRIVGAMSGGVVYTPNGEPVDLQQMMKLYPCPQ